MLVLVQGQFGQKMGTVLGESKVGFGQKMGETLHKCLDNFGGHFQWKKGVDLEREFGSDSENL